MQEHAERKHGGHYARLAVELAVDFVVMYFVMYTMIATGRHLRLNLNNVYMTLMMVAPMAIIMMVAMRSMFPNRRVNLAAMAAAAAVFVASFVAMRTQAGIGDREFLRSMIPHHSGAILMCREAAITDPELVALCKDIVRSQTAEIAQMEAMLQRRSAPGT
ncbi:hypothetical protein GEOBC_00264 [Geobacteraceae bacterium]|nr:hypothetical protein GEOBC_00264 [Geobacteraceae bacterium]